MKAHIPTIPLEALGENELAEYHALNNERYGEGLARKVADKLEQNLSKYDERGYYVSAGGLYHSHRDYCGVGLYFFENRFTFGEVNDAMGPHPIFLTFDDKDEFVEWLSNQSDQSMSLIAFAKDKYVSFIFNNQTITKERLEWYLEENYSPVWNSYCAYLRKRSD